jgi:hypothetical protein
MYGSIGWLAWVETNLFACVWVTNMGTKRSVWMDEANVNLISYLWLTSLHLIDRSM